MKNKNMALFLLPAGVFMTLFLFVPFLQGGYYSLTKWNGNVSEFIGLQNYINLFSDQNFLKSLWFTAKFTIVSIILVNCIAITLALMLYKSNSKLNNFFRTIFFMPN